MSLPSSDLTQLVRHSASQSSVAGQLSAVPVQSESDMMTEESLELMEQDGEESVDSEEDGLRQLLLLQQTKY